MSLVIPGVQVEVVKEVLPQQLAPSGVLGLVGFTEVGGSKVQRASSWTRFIEICGGASAYSLPEARQALDNGVYELVIAPLTGGAAARAIPSSNGPLPLPLVARAPGSWGNRLQVEVTARKDLKDADVFDLSVKRPGGSDSGSEVFRDVTVSTLSEVLKKSSLVKVDGTLPTTLQVGTFSFDGGANATLEDYRNSLVLLEDEPDVDMVLAATQAQDPALLASIYAAVIAHCNRMSSDCKGRIGFGQVPAESTVGDSTRLASNLVSDRFVLTAPNGVVGAVAGKVGDLTYFHSPTSKTVTGLSDLRSIPVEEQAGLLAANVVPIVLQRGKGVMVLRGLTTDGDQISVRRVADHAVRILKMVGELFIGLLNNADQRSALKQKLAAELIQMERDGAIVPSTDGREPSYKLEVYSSQEDFQKGIVRVNMAVRPVRAIDYIYATITIQG